MSTIAPVHPGYSGGSYGLGTMENPLQMAETFVRTRFLKDSIWEKITSPRKADECGNVIYIKNRYERTGGFSEDLINKDWNKPRTLNPTTGKPVALGKSYRDHLIIKKCHYPMMQQHLQEDMMLTMKEIMLMADEKVIRQALASVPKGNRGWKAGKRYGNLQLGSWKQPIVLVDGKIKQFFNQLKQVFIQRDMPWESMNRSKKFMVGPSPLQMLIENSNELTDYDKNGNCRPSCDDLMNGYQPQMVCGWNLCIREIDEPCYLAGTNIPVFEILFGCSDAIYSIWDFVMESSQPSGLKNDKHEICSRFIFDSFPVYPEYLGSAVVAVPGCDFGQAGLPATGG